jgi:hypothetical protein
MGGTMGSTMLKPLLYPLSYGAGPGRHSAMEHSAPVARNRYFFVCRSQRGSW